VTPGERLGFGWRHYPRYVHRLDEGYFIFVEEAALVAAEDLLAPDGLAIASDVILGERLWRFRASGVASGQFLDVMGGFEPLDHDTVTDDQRVQRRNQLVEAFGRRPLPLFDLYVMNGHDELPFLQAMLVPGTWYFITVDRRADADERLAIFVGAPDLDPGPYAPGSLDLLEAVPPFIEYRLRDVFSLVHVPDAGMERTGGATPPHSPDDPMDGFSPAEPFFKLRERYFDDWQLPEAEA
jgi:hypothetical protein